MDTLWAEFLRAKYVGSCHPISVQLKSSASHVWKRMMEARNVAETFITWEINSGNSSAIWDNWLGTKALSNMEGITDCQVSDFVFNGRWNKSRLLQWLPSFPVQYLNSRLLVPDLSKSDQMIWMPESSGEFTLKSAYEAVRQRNPVSFHDSKIWNGSVPQKISFFMSNLWRFRISTDDSLRRLHVLGPSICWCCKDEEETVNHLFITGTRASEIWGYFQRALGISDFTSSLKPRCLLWWNLGSKNPIMQFITQILPLLICWFIWRARNSWRYNGVKTCNFKIITNIANMVFSCVQIQFPKYKICTINWLSFLDSISLFKWKITAIQIPWEDPNAKYLLHTDGSSVSQAAASSGGGILRDYSGQMIFAFSIFFGTGSNMCAEALSLLVGLSLCAKLQVANMAVRCDSRALADMTNGCIKSPWQIRPIIKKISRYKASITEIKHCYKEANTVADALAKEAQYHHSTKVYTSFSHLPSKIRAILRMEELKLSNFHFSKSFP